MNSNITKKSVIDEALEFALKKNCQSEQSSTSLNEITWNCYCYSNIDGNCKGYEELPKASYDSIKWYPIINNKLKVSGDKEKPDEYEYLINYYDLVADYDLDLVADYEVNRKSNVVVEKNICKFKSIKILGYSYKAMDQKEKGGYFCAYHYDKEGKKILRPGQIQFFFKHSLTFPDSSSSSTSTIDHYFAFVRWFKEPIKNHILLELTNEDTSCWENKFEELSENCILPVHKIHSGISIRLNYLNELNVVVFLPKKLY